MGIKVDFDFDRTSVNPIDSSLTLTKAQMATVNDDLMPAKYFTICQDDGAIYLYDKSATAGATGKFSKFEGGSNYTAGDGINITNNEISADFATDTEIENIVTLVFGS